MNSSFQADHVFDGGAQDCGSGLILLIRQNMLQVPVGGVLEIRSEEPTVTAELPPWCRMVGHEHLDSVEVTPGKWRHFVRRGNENANEAETLAADQATAKSFHWNARGRRNTDEKTTVYARNHHWVVGSALSFHRTDSNACALEHLLGALISEVAHHFSVQCSSNGIEVDDFECSAQVELKNVLSAIGAEKGDPAIQSIKLVGYVSSSSSQEPLLAAWKQSLEQGSIYQTLVKSCVVDLRLVVM
ncbi:MAG: hypothetical protein R3C03_19710 [Pirellulaceae bacterium]